MSSLQDLLDAEWLLARPGAAERLQEDRRALRETGRAFLEQRAARPGEFRAALDRGRGPRRELVRAWLDRERAQGTPMPGAWILSIQRWIAAALALCGFVLGVGACAAALSSPSGAPVNLWRVLGLLVLLQVLLLLVLAAAALLFRLRSGDRGPLTGFQRLLQGVQGAALRRWTPVEAMPGQPPALAVDRWSWFGIAQQLGIGFNLGAVVAFLALTLFSDLGFGWSTTPAELPFDLHAVTAVIAAPWSWALPEWAPDPELVRATQWDDLAGAFRPYPGTPPSGFDVEQAPRAWWPFLLLSILTWGLLPRLLLWGFAAWRRRLAVARWTFHGGNWWTLFDLMIPPGTDWSAPEATRPGARTEGAAPLDADTEPAPPPACLVLWGGVPVEDEAWRVAAAREEGLDRARRLHAGGPDAREDDAAAREACATGDGAAWLVAEAGETPDKRVLRFLRLLRDAAGPERPLVVGLCEYAPDVGWQAVRPRDRRIWERTLARLGDRQLRLRVLGPEAAPVEDDDA